MRLTGIPAALRVDVLRDGEFEHLGFLSDNQTAKLVFLESPRHLRSLNNAPGVSCVLTTPELAGSIQASAGVCVCAEPKRTFFRLHNYLARETTFYGESFETQIHETARIHPRAVIASRNVQVGPQSIIEANAVAGEGTRIGAQVRIGAGVVLGSEGFQSARFGESVEDMDHAGGIDIGDRVVILAGAVIARAVFAQRTRIGDECRIGNLAFVSHNVQIGARCFIGHNATVNGNTEIGEEAWIGPGATLSNNLRVGARAQVSLGAVVIRDVEAGQRVTGAVALEHRDMLRRLRTFR